MSTSSPVLLFFGGQVKGQGSSLENTFGLAAHQWGSVLPLPEVPVPGIFSFPGRPIYGSWQGRKGREGCLRCWVCLRHGFCSLGRGAWMVLLRFGCLWAKWGRTNLPSKDHLRAGSDGQGRLFREEWIASSSAWLRSFYSSFRLHDMNRAPRLWLSCVIGMSWIPLSSFHLDHCPAMRKQQSSQLWI